MTYCFPAVLCSRVGFHLSVRQVVSRVILRGSALHYFAQHPIWAHKVDCLFPERCSQFFEGCVFGAAQKDLAVHVANDGIGVVLIQRFQLALCLQHQAGRDFTAADGGHQLLQVRDLPDIGALVDEASHMDRQPPAVHIVGLLSEEVEQLGVYHGNQEVEGAVRVGHDEEQRCFSVAQGVQFQFIVGGDFPQFCDVEGGQSGTTGNQNRLCGLASN